jgi:hypothetical protein
VTHSELLAIVAAWPFELRDLFEERASLVADGCRVTREESERLAFEMLADRAPRKQTALDL